MQPRIPKRPPAPVHAQTASVYPSGVATRGSATGRVAASVTIPLLLVRADTDLQDAGRPNMLPSLEAIRRRGGAGG